MTLYLNIYGVIPSPAMVTVLMGRGTVSENCTHGIPVVNPKGGPLLIMRCLITEQCTTMLWQTWKSMIWLPLFGMRQSDMSSTWSQSLCDTHHMLTVILRCGSHVIHLAAINPKPHRGRQAMANHDDFNDTDMDSNTEHDPSEEDPSWEPGDLLGKALTFVTQVCRL